MTDQLPRPDYIIPPELVDQLIDALTRADVYLKYSSTPPHKARLELAEQCIAIRKALLSNQRFSWRRD